MLANTMKSFISALLFIFSLSSFAANNFYHPKLSTKAKPVLGGRLFIKFPSTNITINNKFANQQTWIAHREITYKVGKKKLTFTLRELMAFRADNFIGQLAKVVKVQAKQIGIRYKISPIDRYRFMAEPSKFRLINNKALIRTLFFVNKDNTVQSISVHANAAAMRNRTQVTKLTLKILNSVKAGKRKIKIKAKSALLISKDRSFQMRIYLPKRYIMMMTENKNSRSYIIQRLLPIGRQPHKITITLGHQPPKNKHAAHERDTSKVHGYLLGQSVSWSKHGKKNHAEGLSLHSFLGLHKIRNNSGRNSLYVHVSVHSDSNKNLIRLKKLAAQLKLSKNSLSRYAFNNRNGFNNTLARNENNYDRRPDRKRSSTAYNKVEHEDTKARILAKNKEAKKNEAKRRVNTGPSFADRILSIFGSSSKKKEPNKIAKIPERSNTPIRTARRNTPKAALADNEIIEEKESREEVVKQDERFVGNNNAREEADTYPNAHDVKKNRKILARNKRELEYSRNERAREYRQEDNSHDKEETEYREEENNHKRQVYRYRRIQEEDDDDHYDREHNSHSNRAKARNQHNKHYYDYRYEADDEDDPYYQNDADYDSTYYGH